MMVKRLTVGVVAGLVAVGALIGAGGVPAAAGATPPTTVAAIMKSGDGLTRLPRPHGSSQPSVGSSSTSGVTAGTSATAAESTGLVLVDTEVDYGAAAAAGTGLVIDQSGIVVTNHHVVAGSTTVEVAVPATGQTYRADVLGYDATADVAVLRLENASGLATVTTDAAAVSAGQSVTAVGNAEGQSQLISSSGQVTTPSTDVTVSSESGDGTEQLSGVIEMNAALVPGDSGGAVFDSAGDVVAMNVAGSTNPAVTTSFAIPIATVLGVADSVLAGQSSATVTLGRTAALGIQVAVDAADVVVVGVFSGSAAETAGLTAGSVVTALGGSTVASEAQLSALLAQHAPGDQVSLAWTDRSGTTHTAEVTLGSGPLA